MNYSLGAPLNYDSMNTVDFSSNPYYNQQRNIEYKGNGNYIDPIIAFSDDAHIPLSKKKDLKQDNFKQNIDVEKFRGGGGHGGGGGGYGGGGHHDGGGGYGGGHHGGGHHGGGHHGGGFSRYGLGAASLGAGAIASYPYIENGGYYDDYDYPVEIVNQPVQIVNNRINYEEMKNNDIVKIESVEEQKNIPKKKLKNNKLKIKSEEAKSDKKNSKPKVKKEIDPRILWLIIFLLIIIIIIMGIYIKYPKFFMK